MCQIIKKYVIIWAYQHIYVILQAKIRELMKKISILLISMLLSISPIEAKDKKTVKIKVIETSDVHGHFFPYDFMEQRPIKGTLSRANTYIKKQRKKYGENHFLLIDNGDILQGQRREHRSFGYQLYEIRCRNRR